jgi:hypothetical protein
MTQAINIGGSSEACKYDRTVVLVNLDLIASKGIHAPFLVSAMQPPRGLNQR